MDTIGELILARLDGQGWSRREFSDATGGVVSHQSLSAIIAGPKQWPKHNDTILGLARALAVHPETVVLAYAAALGIPIKSQPSRIVTALPESADLLTGAEVTHIAGIITALTHGRTNPDK